MVAGSSRWKFLTPKEVADIFRIEESLVKQLIRDRQVQALPVGNEWRISEESVDAYIKRSLGRTPSETGSMGHLTDAVVEEPYDEIRPSRRTREVEFILLGRHHRAANSITVLAKVLTELAGRDATFLERFSKEGGRTRRYVARDRQLLYDRRPDLAEKFAKRLTRDWWMSTNYNRREIDGAIRRACDVANIRFGVDFQYYLPKRQVDRMKAMGFVGRGRDPDPDASVRHDELFVESILSSEP